MTCVFSNKRLIARLMPASPQTCLRSDNTDTKNGLLNATERLFASHGFAGVTMRGVADRAHTNIASAHYHYGSKEGMVMAMLKRRLSRLMRTASNTWVIQEVLPATDPATSRDLSSLDLASLP